MSAFSDTRAFVIKADKCMDQEEINITWAHDSPKFIRVGEKASQNACETVAIEYGIPLSEILAARTTGVDVETAIKLGGLKCLS